VSRDEFEHIRQRMAHEELLIRNLGSVRIRPFGHNYDGETC
jgi:hypothetical protein